MPLAIHHSSQRTRSGAYERELFRPCGEILFDTLKDPSTAFGVTVEMVCAWVAGHLSVCICVYLWLNIYFFSVYGDKLNCQEKRFFEEALNYSLKSSVIAVLERVFSSTVFTITAQ